MLLLLGLQHFLLVIPALEGSPRVRDLTLGWHSGTQVFTEE